MDSRLRGKDIYSCNKAVGITNTLSQSFHLLLSSPRRRGSISQLALKLISTWIPAYAGKTFNIYVIIQRERQTLFPSHSTSYCHPRVGGNISQLDSVGLHRQVGNVYVAKRVYFKLRNFKVDLLKVH